MVNTLVNAVGNASEGLALGFALGLLLFAPIDGLSGCGSSYTRAQRNWRGWSAYAAMITLLALGATPSFGAGFMVGGLLAMRALQSLYKELPQPAYAPARRTTAK